MTLTKLMNIISDRVYTEIHKANDNGDDLKISIELDFSNRTKELYSETHIEHNILITDFTKIGEKS